jgi:hypothetical protein
MEMAPAEPHRSKQGEPGEGPRRFRIPWMWGFLLFLAIAVFFLWEEHRAHLLGAIPFVLVALCLLLHPLMHGRHGGGSGQEGPAPHRHAGGGS